MKKPYMLEIYEPDSTRDVFVSYESSNPIANMNVGDLLCPVGTKTGFNDSLFRLEIVRIEHLVWEFEEGLKQKMCVYTTARDNSSLEMGLSQHEVMSRALSESSKRARAEEQRDYDEKTKNAREATARGESP
jgi:hypothetical protein